MNVFSVPGSMFCPKRVPLLRHFHGELGIDDAMAVTNLITVNSVALAHRVSGGVGEERWLRFVMAETWSQADQRWDLREERRPGTIAGVIPSNGSGLRNKPI